LLLEGKQNTLKYLAIGGIGTVALEMQVHAATAQLAAQIAKGKQLISP
jgi:hypothetical protein